MNIIKNNPFRVLGLPANSTERELQKRIAIVKRFADVGKTKDFDYDFLFFGNLDRTEETVQQASSRIEQIQQKVHNALFWFTSKNSIDETALSYLKDGDIDKAIDIWQKTLKDDISDRNYISYANLSTLLIGIASTNGSVKKELLKQGIDLKYKLLSSEKLQLFVSDITGNGTISEREKLNSDFANEILQLTKPYLDNRQISQKELISYFNSFPESIKKNVASKFSDTHIYNVENEIEKAINKRKETPIDAEKHGEELYKNTKVDITELKNIFGQNNIQFQILSDKLAKEIMQCGIDYFSHYKDSTIDPGGDSMKLFKIAQSLAINSQTKDRVKENIEGLQEWIDNKPIREKQKRIESDLEFITNKLERFQQLSDTVANAKELANYCESKIQNIKLILGGTDGLYLELSSAIVRNSQGMLVTAVNEAQESFGKFQEIGGEIGVLLLQQKFNNSNQNSHNLKFVTLSELKSIVNEAYDLTSLLSSFDMECQLRESFNQNRNSLSNIRTQINIAYSQNQTSSSSSSSGSSGCYIATMVYGSYEHPQVLVLRKFRDEKLSNTIIGKKFISFYYATSPTLVKLCKNNNKINSVIKSILDKLISKL